MPNTPDPMVEKLAALGVDLPLATLSSVHPGVVIDANDITLFVVDPDGELTDQHAGDIAAALISIINRIAPERAA